MVQVDETTQGVLNQISEGFEQKGAYNLRQNGIPLCHGDSEHIKIKKKTDKPGIDIYIDGDTKGEKVYTMISISRTARTLRSLRDAGSTTADAMRADMTGSTPFMLERMRTSVIRKSIMEREMEPAAVC